eukprot:2021137-Rhodomonas_salina.2
MQKRRLERRGTQTAMQSRTVTREQVRRADKQSPQTESESHRAIHKELVDSLLGNTSKLELVLEQPDSNNSVHSVAPHSNLSTRSTHSFRAVEDVPSPTSARLRAANQGNRFAAKYMVFGDDDTGIDSGSSSPAMAVSAADHHKEVQRQQKNQKGLLKKSWMLLTGKSSGNSPDSTERKALFSASSRSLRC